MEALLIQSDSECPSPAAVQAEVRELTTPAQRDAVAADAKVLVSDRGESIAVAITRDGTTTVRIYQDAARDCARRGHFVSVLAVVSLMPPELTSPAEPAPAPPPEPPAPEPLPAEPARAEPAPRRHVRIELGARAELSTPISDSARIAAVGGALGVALGAGRFRPTLGIGYLPPTELLFTGSVAGSAELERLDMAAGLRVLLTHAPFDLGLDLAALAARSEVTGKSTMRQTQDTAFSVGARAGVTLCLAEQRLLSPFLGAHASFFPLTPELSQLPQGTVGHLPYVWFGLSGGLSLAL